MPLREEFESTGNWLFRWRSYLPLFLIGLFLLALPDYEYPGHSKQLNHLWEAFCLIVSLLGLSVRVFTIGYTPKGTSGRNTRKQVADTLNTTGAYSVVRNPLYLGNFFMGLGPALFAHLWWLALIYTLAFWLYYERIIFAEESYLRNQFGSEYIGWASVTPCIVPKFSKYVRPRLPFSLRNALRREYNGLFAVIAVMFMFELLGDLVAEGRFEVDFGWIVLIAISFIVWLTLRTLKRRTTVLDMEGR